MPDQSFWAAGLRKTLVTRVGQQIWGYLHAHALPVEHRSILEGLGKLLPSDFDRLIDQRVLLEPEVRHFVEVDGHDLLRSFAKSTEIVFDGGLGAIRGSIDWQRTTSARAQAGGLDAPGFVWRSVQRRYDLPENRLVKMLVRRLAGTCDGVLNGLDGEARPGTWHQPVLETKSLTTLILGHALMRQVTDTDVVPPVAWSRSRAHRISAYRKAAELLEWLDEAYKRLSRINVDLLGRTFLSPLADDTVFELFTLTKVIEALTAEDWQLSRVRTVHGASGPVFTFERGDAHCSLRYQSVPKQLAESSHYRALLHSAQIDPGTRRPDIILEITRPEKRWIGLIEVKLSRRRQYMADGIYKVLAYLRDFSQLLDAQPPPRALLVTWRGPQFFSPSGDVGMVTAHQHLGSQIRPFVRAALQAVS